MATTGAPMVSADPSPQPMAVCLAPVGEEDPHLVAVQVVRVGQHLPGFDHYARPAAPAVADAHRRASRALGDAVDCFAQILDRTHRFLHQVLRLNSHASV
jgi:hypothetical protein